VGSVVMPVMCVKKHSQRSLILRHTSLHIVDSVLMPVMCVEKHSFRSLILRHTNLYTVDSVLLPVICVIIDSFWRLILKHTSSHTVASDLMPVLLLKQLSLIKRHQLMYNSFCIACELCNKTFLIWSILLCVVTIVTDWFSQMQQCNYDKGGQGYMFRPQFETIFGPFVLEQLIKFLHKGVSVFCDPKQLYKVIKIHEFTKSVYVMAC
jgi:hypothetical protein